MEISKKRLPLTLCLVVLFGLILSCNVSNPTAQPLPPRETPNLRGKPEKPTDSLPLASATEAPPAFATTSAPPADTIALTNTSLPALPTNTTQPPSPTPESMTVKIFLIALEDNGASGPLVGCGDSAVSVDVVVPYSTGVLRAALVKLLSIHSPYYGESGLYNALYSSNLTVDGVTISGGNAVIRLSGSLSLAGECDDPRVKAQLEKTALQFSTVTSVTIYVNGTLLQDLLSGHG